MIQNRIRYRGIRVLGTRFFGHTTRLADAFEICNRARDQQNPVVGTRREPQPRDRVLNIMYKAFMSYSHAADGRLAPTLQSALHRFAKPWYRLRALSIF